MVAVASEPGKRLTLKLSPSSHVSLPPLLSSTMTSLKSSHAAALLSSMAPNTAKASNFTATVQTFPGDQVIVAALSTGRQYPRVGQLPATTSRWPTLKLATARNTTVARTALGVERGKTSSKLSFAIEGACCLVARAVGAAVPVGVAVPVDMPLAVGMASPVVPRAAWGVTFAKSASNVDEVIFAFSPTGICASSSGDHWSTLSSVRITTLNSPEAPDGSCTRPSHASLVPAGSRWHPRTSKPTSGSQSPRSGPAPTRSASPSPRQPGMVNPTCTTRSALESWLFAPRAVPRDASVEAPGTIQEALRLVRDTRGEEGDARAMARKRFTPRGETLARLVPTTAVAETGATATMATDPGRDTKNTCWFTRAVS